MDENKGEMLDEKDDEVMAESAHQQLLEKEAEEVVATVLENVPEEKQEELSEKVRELAQPKPVLGSLQGLKNLFALAIPKPSSGTKAHNPNRKRGVGVTRKNKSQSKSARKQSKNSRKINRGK